MAYNKILQNTFPDLGNFEDDNSIIKKDNALKFVDNLNISKKIDDIQNSIDQIVFEGTNIIVSGNLKFLDTSSFSNLKSLGGSSKVLKFVNLDVGLKLNTDEDLEFYNNIEEGDIHLSSSISIPSNTLYVINKASGSITHLDEAQNLPLIAKTGGGLSISSKLHDEQKPETKYLEMSFTDTGSVVSSAPFNVSYLSNKLSNCKVFNSNYADDPDVLQIKGNYYYQADYKNPGNTTLEGIFGTYWVNNTSIILNSNSYKIIPQCTILRPLNSTNPTEDNINHYMTGDTHYIKMKNNDSITELTDTKTINMFLIDLTASAFQSNLKPGFKVDILIDEFNENIYDIKNENNTFPASSVALRNNGYTNYLPNRELPVSLTGQWGTSKFYPIGFEKISLKASPASGNGTQKTGGYFPSVISRQNSSPYDNAPINISINGYNYVYGGYDVTKSTFYKIPTGITLNDGDFFYFEISIQESTLNKTSFVIQNQNGTTMCSIGSNPTGKLVMNTTSNKNTYTLNNLPIGINTTIFKFVYSSSLSEWQYTGSNLGSQEDFEEQFMADFGLLQKPTSFCVELPTGHNIVNISTDIIASALFLKNPYSFYLYGDRATVYPGNNGFIQGGTHRRIKGGWLKINDENNLPYNQATIKSGFKKRYDNLFLLNPKKSNQVNSDFSWQKYSNFQLTYLGNNEWFMS